eukprot:18166_1
MSESVSVAIRVRPLTEREEKENSESVWVVDKERSSISQTGSPHSAVYDHVFDGDDTNENVYKMVCKHVVTSAMEGINGTIFAYGQTSSGKTFTMRGELKNPGVTPRAILDMVAIIENSADREYLIHVSYLEIYNEEIQDLLSPKNYEMKILQDYQGNLIISGLTRAVVNSPKEFLTMFDDGNLHRHTGSTAMNDESSRSHTIFQLHIESRKKNSDDQAVRVSCLNLVDLAGSERQSLTKSTGDRLVEGCHINKSLLTLGKVIRQLSEKKTTTRPTFFPTTPNSTGNG